MTPVFSSGEVGEAYKIVVHHPKVGPCVSFFFGEGAVKIEITLLQNQPIIDKEEVVAIVNVDILEATPLVV